MTVNKKTLCQCTICGHKWRPRLSGLLGYRGCPHCSKREKYTTESFKEMVNAINPDIIILGEYVNGSTKIHCKCIVCNHEWDPCASGLLQGCGCPVCAIDKKVAKIHKKYNTETLKERLTAINPNVTVLGEYTGNNTKVKCSCDVCGYV